jgi:hypothetical protein
VLDGSYELTGLCFDDVRRLNLVCHANHDFLALYWDTQKTY